MDAVNNRSWKVLNNKIVVDTIGDTREDDGWRTEGVLGAGKMKMKIAKYTVDWAPKVMRVFEPLRIVYPLHVIDDSAVDNEGGYTRN